MENLTASAPQNVVEVLKQGKKIAIFTVNDEQQPIALISDINITFPPVLDRIEILIEPAIRYVKNNYNKDIKLDYLSELCQLSPNYFCSLYSKVCGKSVTAHIKHLRLSQACLLLKNTNQAIVEIATQVGYVDCGYFNKVFKRNFGCTPVQYRNLFNAH